MKLDVLVVGPLGRCYKESELSTRDTVTHRGCGSVKGLEELAVLLVS